MFRALITSFIFSLTLLLAACGSDGNSAASGGSGISGSSSSVAMKGVLKGASIQVQKWENGAYVTTETVTTDNEGSFTLALAGAEPGDVYKLILSNTAGNAITMVCDATQCGTAGFGDDVSLTGGLELSSWATVGDDGAITIMPITPVSTLLVSYAESLNNGRLTAGNIAVSRNRVAALFRLTPDEVMAVPGNIASSSMMASMTDASRKISLLSAAFAELSGGDVGQMGADIQRFSQAFIYNNGRLLEADSSGTFETLHTIYTGAYAAANVAASSTAQALALKWADDIISLLRDGEPSVTCPNALTDGTCPTINSDRFVDALGAMGNDVRTVINEHNYPKLEDAIAGELNKFGWLISQDTFALAGVAVQAVGFSISAVVNNTVKGLTNGMMDSMFPLQEVNGLYPALNGNTLTVTGEQNGLTVDLTITLPDAWDAMNGDKSFPIHVSGTVGNDRVSGVVDADVQIDATGTNFTAFTNSLTALANNMNQIMLKSFALAQTNDPEQQAQLQSELEALQLQTLLKTRNAVTTGADLAKTAKLKVDIDFQKARLVKKGENGNPDSRLSIEGQGSVTVDMKGGSYGGKDERITLNGEVTGGEIMLPNGSFFAVKPGESLTFSMGKDGRFDADVSVSILTLFKAKGYGKLDNMGVLVSDLRDDIVNLLTGVLTQSEDEEKPANIGGLLIRLVTNLGSLDLLVEGDVTMVEPGKSYTGHVYKARLANTVLTVSQPDKPLSNKALELSLGWDGLHVTAGKNWWHIGLDLSSGLLQPAIVMEDDTGSALRYQMNFASLIAGG